MESNSFRASLTEKEPPQDVPPLLQALWWDAKGNWGKAHEIAQEIDSRNAAWVHAYLHRKEGDAGNAAYWYGQAGRPVYEAAVESEWMLIVQELLGDEPGR